MDITLKPKFLQGKIQIPPSKSLLHRILICSYLSKNTIDLTKYSLSKDISATKNALENLQNNAIIDCGESGSTLRFLIPVACALGLNVKFTGCGRLPQRPLTPYFRELTKKGISFSREILPFDVTGQLQSGDFQIEGNISSQFISGLLFALPLLEGDSNLTVLGKHESKSYTDMTKFCLEKCGIVIEEDAQKGIYYIKGGQKYTYQNIEIEGDYSQAAFFLTANFLGSSVEITNLSQNSVQNDSTIVNELEKIATATTGKVEISAENIPDLVPILAVAGSFGNVPVHIVNAARLRIKESDRLAAITAALNEIGGNIAENADGLVIKPVKNFKGGIVDSVNDHRIAMAVAIATSRATAPVTILNAECIEKSYPEFWEEISRLSK